MARLRILLMIFSLISIISLIHCKPPLTLEEPDAIPKVQLWNRFELSQSGPKENKTINPFEDYDFGANFTYKSLSFYVYGFYDGNGIYKVRFMPNTVGVWNYVTFSNDKSMNGIKGQFNCTAASSTNYGVAYVNASRSTKSFTWSQNNNAYFSVGTTSYAFIHYPNETVITKTLSTLKSLANNPTFNKIRFLLFPKWYRYTHIEPTYYPYVSNGGLPQNTTNWNFKVFNVSFWQHLESILTQISTMNNGNFIVDLILFHPYDYGHWGFDCMGGTDASKYNTSNDIFYLKYAIARLASYRNIWWSMANEFDLIHCKGEGLPKTFPIWDELFQTLVKYDPYDGAHGRIPQKEKSIHQAGYSVMYNYSQPWTTHFSVQSYDDVNYGYFQSRFNVSKPVILDEVQYEGNLSNYSIDDLSAAQETDRFWMANSNGNMCGHSEDVLPNSTDNPAGTTILWNNFGEVLRGESYGKIGWFYNYMVNLNIHPPFDQLTSKCLLLDTWNDDNIPHCLISSLEKSNDFYLIHWSNYSETNYERKINLTLSPDLYKLSYIDYMAQSIKVVNQSLNGTNISISPPSIPYNIELINIKSQYFNFDTYYETHRKYIS